MRTGLTILILTVAAFCGYWFVGAHLFQRGVEDWLAAQAEAGRSAEVQELEIAGFPTRFAATSGTVVIVDPETGWGWQTPSAAVSMPSWWPFRVTADLAEQHVLDTPRGQFDITAQDLTGRIGLSPRLAPVDLHARSNAIRAVGAGGSLQASEFLFDSTRLDGATHHATLSVQGLGLEAGRVTLIGGTLTAEADVTLAERLDDLPDAVGLPIDTITLRDGELRFDRVAVRASGTLVADGRGFAAGELTLRLENWPEALEAAVAAGLIQENRVGLLEGGFRMMADGDVLELPLTLAGGDIRFGPFPLGPAPRLR